MEISVIIPCFNLESYIANCLRSVLKQLYERAKLEVIIVVDSCTDFTEIIAKNILQGEVSYKVIQTSCGRAGLARNVGLEEASGEYVWFVDGDDYLIDNLALVKLTEIMRTCGATAVYMSQFESDEPIQDDFAIWRYFYDRRFIGHERFGDQKIDEDWEFTRRLAEKPCYKEIRTAEKFYHYTYPREGSIITEFMKIRRKMSG